MSDLVIRQLLESRLKTLAPTFPTSSENVTFTPTSNVPYQAVTVLPSPTLNPTVGGTFKREMGLMQIALYYPAGAGAGPATTKAEAIKAHFKRGTTMMQGTLRVLIHQHPYTAKGQTKDGWFQLLTYVPYIGDVYQ